jgi:hypothetical protein
MRMRRKVLERRRGRRGLEGAALLMNNEWRESDRPSKCLMDRLELEHAWMCRLAQAVEEAVDLDKMFARLGCVSFTGSGCVDPTEKRLGVNERSKAVEGREASAGVKAGVYAKRMSV